MSDGRPRGSAKGTPIQRSLAGAGRSRGSSKGTPIQLPLAGAPIPLRGGLALQKAATRGGGSVGDRYLNDDDYFEDNEATDNYNNNGYPESYGYDSSENEEDDVEEPENCTSNYTAGGNGFTTEVDVQKNLQNLRLAKLEKEYKRHGYFYCNYCKSRWESSNVFCRYLGMKNGKPFYKPLHKHTCRGCQRKCYPSGLRE